MTFPFPVLAPVLSGLLGFFVHLYKSADSTSSTGTPVTWDTEVSDLQNVHDNVTNNSRITIPTAWNGRYGFFQLNAAIGTAGNQFLQRKNGTANNFLGCIRHCSDNTSGDDIKSFVGPPIQVTAGDYYDLDPVGASYAFRAATSSISFTLFPSNFSGCLVYNSTDQAIGAAATITLSHDTEAYDIGGWHDTSVNPSRITVPSGKTLIRLFGGVTNVQAGANQTSIRCTKNGAAVDGVWLKDIDFQATCQVTGMSAPLAVSSGDYFEMQVNSETAGSAKTGNGTWFGAMELSSSLEYALVKKSTTQSIASASTVAITFDTEVADTSNIHDNALNNTRLTVPSGWTKARVGFNLSISGSGTQRMEIYKNGSPLDKTNGAAVDDNQGPSDDAGGGWTPVITVSPGDYFELFVTNSTIGVTARAGTDTWFCLEKVTDVTS